MTIQESTVKKQILHLSEVSFGFEHVGLKVWTQAWGQKGETPASTVASQLREQGQALQFAW